MARNVIRISETFSSRTFLHFLADCCLMVQSFHLIIAIALLVTPLYGSEHLRMALYWATGVEAGQSGLPFAWASEICTADTEERSLVIAAMNVRCFISYT